MSVKEQLFGANRDWLAHTTSSTTRVTEEKVVVMDDGTGVQLQDAGLLYLTPPESLANNGESLIISAGVHGNETAPIEVLNGRNTHHALLLRRLILKPRRHHQHPVPTASIFGSKGSNGPRHATHMGKVGVG
jgi:hypothetical protein